MHNNMFLVFPCFPNNDSRYPEILQSLFTVAHTRENGRILDNVCAAVCRMVMANQQAVPLDQVQALHFNHHASIDYSSLILRNLEHEPWVWAVIYLHLYPIQVLPVLIQSLPLKEDMEENSTVYRCILQLFENKNPTVSFVRSTWAAEGMCSWFCPGILQDIEATTAVLPAIKENVVHRFCIHNLCAHFTSSPIGHFKMLDLVWFCYRCTEVLLNVLCKLLCAIWHFSNWYILSHSSVVSKKIGVIWVGPGIHHLCTFIYTTCVAYLKFQCLLSWSLNLLSPFLSW